MFRTKKFIKIAFCLCICGVYIGSTATKTNVNENDHRSEDRSSNSIDNYSNHLLEKRQTRCQVQRFHNGYRRRCITYSGYQRFRGFRRRNPPYMRFGHSPNNKFYVQAPYFHSHIIPNSSNRLYSTPFHRKPLKQSRLKHLKQRRRKPLKQRRRKPSKQKRRKHRKYRKFRKKTMIPSIRHHYKQSFTKRPHVRFPPHRRPTPTSIPTQENHEDNGRLMKAKTMNSEHCGKRSIQPLGGRIVGGRQASPKEFPWQVAIQVNEGDDEYQIRGGAVILNKRWVLTAAHVFLRGVIGINNLNDKGTYLKFDKIIKHEKYADEPGEYDNDIALLHTTEDMPLFPAVDNINSICLPHPGQQFKNKVTVTGWGKTGEMESETNQLMTVDIRVLKDEVCERNFKRYFKRRIMICAGNLKGGKDSCSGDSGGPLIQRNWDEDRFYLAGIVSFGGHQKCARKGSGASYTKVTQYLDWIQRHIKD